MTSVDPAGRGVGVVSWERRCERAGEIKSVQIRAVNPYSLVALIISITRHSLLRMVNRAKWARTEAKSASTTAGQKLIPGEVRVKCIFGWRSVCLTGTALLLV